MNPALEETTDNGYQRPRDPVEIWVARQWQGVLGFAVGIRENFFGVGGNSLDAARVIDAVLADFGIQLPLNVLAEHPTVEHLAALLRDHGGVLPGPLAGPLITIQDGDGTRPPLFLVHPDSGQAGIYCALAHDLGEEFTVSALQAPALYTAAGPARTIPELAAAYTAALQAAHPAGPYQLGGAGIGAATDHPCMPNPSQFLDGCIFSLTKPQQAAIFGVIGFVGGAATGALWPTSEIVYRVPAAGS